MRETADMQPISNRWFSVTKQSCGFDSTVSKVYIQLILSPFVILLWTLRILQQPQMHIDGL